MKGFDRALRMLGFEPTDRVPTFGGWVASAPFFEHVTGRSFWEDPVGVACQAYRALEVDIVLENLYLPVSLDEWRAEVVSKDLLDREKFRTPEQVLAYVKALPEPETVAHRFDFESELEVVRRRYEDLRGKLAPECFCLPSAKCCRFDWFNKFGYESYLMALAIDPAVMGRLYRYSAEQARLQNLVRVALVERGVMPPVFFTGHDICGNQGPMVSPRLLRTIYFPALKRAFKPLVAIGADIVWHSDGYILPILNDLVQCGVSGFQGFQERTGFNVGDIARRQVRQGRRPLLLAGVQVDSVLPFGNVDDVKREIERIVHDAGAGGGLAIGTANTAGPDCSIANLEALYTHPHTLSPPEDR